MTPFYMLWYFKWVTVDVLDPLLLIRGQYLHSELLQTLKPLSFGTDPRHLGMVVVCLQVKTSCDMELVEGVAISSVELTILEK